MSYQAGVIGAGGIAGLGILGLHDPADIGEKRFATSHAGGYEATADIELVAATDVDTDKLERFGDVWDIPPNRRYGDLKTFLGEESLDVISVCSPTYLHRDHVVRAARSDAAPEVIWCEKPIASNLTDAEEMCDVCAETGTELVINHSFRFAEPYRALKAAIEDGLVGDIRAISGNFRRELLRNSTHLLDTIFFLTQAEVDRVSGYINGENDAVDTLDGNIDVTDSGGGGHVVFEDDLFATIDCTVARDISSMTIVITGTEGKLHLNNDHGEWRYWRLEDGTHEELPLPHGGGTWEWEEDYRAAFANAAEHAVELLDGHVENQSPGEEATRSLEIIIGFYLSHYLGSHVSFPLEPPLRDVTITSW